jgi:CrcB protein
MNVAVIAGIAVAGALGAPARYLLDGFVQDRTTGVLPWGTLVVNATGSFALGLLTGAALYHAFPSTPKTILGTGFCGAYTTFSTFSFETVRLLEDGATTEAVVNVALSLLVGLVAAAAGLALAAL